MTVTTTHLHPDYDRIQAGIALTESRIQECDHDSHDHAHAAVNRLVGEFADPDSVRAVAIDRTDFVLDIPELILLNPTATLRSIWMDGFTAGVQFQQAGGHTEP